MEQQFVATRNVAVVLQPPHLPDLTPCDFFLVLENETATTGASFPECFEI
jgi:hypothetical protein